MRVDEYSSRLIRKSFLFSKGRLVCSEGHLYLLFVPERNSVKHDQILSLTRTSLTKSMLFMPGVNWGPVLLPSNYYTMNN